MQISPKQSFHLTEDKILLIRICDKKYFYFYFEEREFLSRAYTVNRKKKGKKKEKESREDYMT